MNETFKTAAPCLGDRKFPTHTWGFGESAESNKADFIVIEPKMPVRCDGKVGRAGSICLYRAGEMGYKRLQKADRDG